MKNYLKLKNKVWAKKHKRCRKCKTDESPHEGKGLCRKCYDLSRKKTDSYKRKVKNYRKRRKYGRFLNSVKNNNGKWAKLVKEKKLIQMRFNDELIYVPIKINLRDKLYFADKYTDFKKYLEKYGTNNFET